MASEILKRGLIVRQTSKQERIFNGWASIFIHNVWVRLCVIAKQRLLAAVGAHGLSQSWHTGLCCHQAQHQLSRQEVCVYVCVFGGHVNVATSRSNLCWSCIASPPVKLDQVFTEACRIKPRQVEGCMCVWECETCVCLVQAVLSCELLILGPQMWFSERGGMWQRWFGWVCYPVWVQSSASVCTHVKRERKVCAHVLVI